MPYADIETIQRKAKIVLEPKGFGLPYQKLFDSTDVSGYELYVLESTNDFVNPLQQSMEKTYKEKGWFGLILRDVIRNGKGTDGKGRLNVNYISHAGTEWEKEHDVWAPKNGFYVPNDDCEKINGVIIPFQLGTLVPFETVDKKKDAAERFEKYGLDPKYVSRFYRLDKYDSERFAGRDFDPDVGDFGRFVADLDWLPSDSGIGRVGALPVYDEKRDGNVSDMTVVALPEKK